MIRLAIRTDSPVAEIYILIDGEVIAEKKWEGHRRLAETLHTEIHALLTEKNLQLSGIQEVVVYKGPGSFTGLRIGISVANALSYALGIPIFGGTDSDWIHEGRSLGVVEPYYGSEVRITAQKR